MLGPRSQEAKRLAELLSTCDNDHRGSVAQQMEALGPYALFAVLPLLSNQNWSVRFWAAQVVGAMRTAQARAALERCHAIETEDTVKWMLDRVLAAFPPVLMDQRTVTQIQAQIIALRNRLQHMNSNLGEDSDEIKQLREQLVNAQVELRQRLALEEMDATELEELHEFYWSASSAEKRRYRNACWVCLAAIDSDINERCKGCGWYICHCRACQCPDFSHGPKRHDPECQLQIQRLGQAHYAELVKARQARTAGYEVEPPDTDDYFDFDGFEYN